MIRWRDASGTGLEHAELRRSDAGISIASVVIGPAAEAFAIAYQLTCDAAWRTSRLELRLVGTDRILQLATDTAGQWRDADGPRPDLAGCLDVDITATPMTNTLPIRRAPLAVGECIEIRAAYIVVPELRLEVSRQRYTRLTPHHYRFETPDDGFSREITVDDDGVVVDYPGLFTRV